MPVVTQISLVVILHLVVGFVSSAVPAYRASLDRQFASWKSMPSTKFIELVTGAFPERQNVVSPYQRSETGLHNTLAGHRSGKNRPYLPDPDKQFPLSGIS
jgi:hypothetical protein